MPAKDMIPGRWWPRVFAWLRQARAFGASRFVRLSAFVLAVPLFGLGLVLAWSHSGVTAEAIRPAAVAIVAAFVPLTVLLSTWQFRVLGGMSGVRIGWWRASRVVTLGTLSGLLPISSGTVVRGGAIVYWGGEIGGVAQVLLLDSLVWLGLAFCYSGTGALSLGAQGLGPGLWLAGGLLVVLAVWFGGWLGQGRGKLMQLAGARLGGVIVESVRLMAALAALDTVTSLAASSVLVSASPLASLLFFLPGGLGVREAFTAVAAAAIGGSAGAAFLAAALNRLVGLTVLLIWESAIIIVSAGRPARNRHEDDRGDVKEGAPK